jgi:hypothetical protein
MSNKEIAIAAIRELPDGVSLEDIQERLAILAALRRADEDFAAGRTVSHEEAKRRVASSPTGVT